MRDAFTVERAPAMSRGLRCSSSSSSSSRLDRVTVTHPDFGVGRPPVKRLRLLQNAASHLPVRGSFRLAPHGDAVFSVAGPRLRNERSAGRASPLAAHLQISIFLSLAFDSACFLSRLCSFLLYEFFFYLRVHHSVYSGNFFPSA